MRPLFRTAGLLLACIGAWPSLAGALTLDQALRLAERQAPSLAAQAANLSAARSAAIPAGKLPDPQLRLGIQNLPIEGDARYRLEEDGMTMQMIGFMQAVPNRAKREARIDAAEAGIAVAERQRDVERLRVRRETAQAWTALLAVERKLALFDGLYRENRLLAEAVRARLAGGQGRVAEAVLPKQEAALLAEREDTLIQTRDAARAALRRWIGDAADQRPTGDWPRWPTEPARYRHHLSAHPELVLFDPRTELAEAQVREALADKRPDWAWGVDYQRRGREYGDMLSLSVSMDLPLFSATRQDPKIAARRARVEQLDAEHEAARRELRETLETQLAEHRRAARAVDRLEQVLLPLAEEKVALAMDDYRAGRGDLTAVIDARRERVETRLRAIDLAAERAALGARLYYAFGETP